MSAPFMQLYVADYLGDTRHLTTEQHGAYLLLLMTMWRSDGVLSDDPAKLARIAGLTVARWKKVSDDVMAMFTPCEGGITQARLAAELTIADEKSEKRSEAGRAGGRAKALKDKKASVANAKPMPCHSPEPEPEKIIEAKASQAASPSPSPEGIAFAEWNDLAKRLSLPVASKLTAQRLKHLRVRLREDGLDGWRRALVAVERSRHCRGENDRAWRADIDFLLQPKSFTRLVEGFYGSDAKPAQQATWDDDRWRAALSLHREEGLWSDRMGPKPGAVGCRAPAAILAEFGMLSPPANQNLPTPERKAG